MSTGKLFNPGEYQEKVESVRAPKKCLNQYRKMVECVHQKIVESGRELGKARIRAST